MKASGDGRKVRKYALGFSWCFEVGMEKGWAASSESEALALQRL